MDESAAARRRLPAMIPAVGLAGGLYLAGYALLSVATGQANPWVGNLAQTGPPLAFAVLAVLVGRRTKGQGRIFWYLSASYGLMWVTGQMVWTYYAIARGGVAAAAASDPILFLAGLPLAAALYGRPDRNRPRSLFDIILLDVVLIALFAAFTYLYFVASLIATDGPEEVYRTNLTQLFHARNLLLAAWAGQVWYTASLRWRRVLGLFAAGLALKFVGGFVQDVVDAWVGYAAGSFWDLAWMLPFLVLSLAAAQAHDDGLFAPSDAAPPMPRLPVLSLIAIGLLVLIPTIDEVSRRLFDVPPEAQALRTRLALVMMIPFGIIVFLREFLSRRALVRAGQQLVSTREELAHKEKLAAVGQLVSGVAHELNNPLQGVLGYAELMTMSHRDTPESDELKAIRENANRAAAIVRNLLTFAGRATPARTWQQINTLIREAAQQRAPFLQGSEIHVELALADRLPLAYVDALRFQQVLINLLENAEAAVGARRSGRVPAGAIPASQPGEIVVTTRRAAAPDRIVIEIADNGSGVRTEDLSKIFDPFFTTRAVGEGTGLGLSVCYGVVREHGGLIGGRNRDAGGAVFSIELPVSPDASQQRYIGEAVNLSLPLPAPVSALPEPAREPIVGRAPRALVVDDEDSNATLVRRALEQVGYEVESTTLSRRALVLMERASYDVVVTDVKMPELNGQELYTRACQIRPEMSRRFIFITGDIENEDTLDFLERCHCAYFMKPFHLERLTSAVDMLVNGGRRDGRIG